MACLASRIRGSLIGVAVCDALGGPVEFQRRGKFPKVVSYRHNDHFDLPPGAWTDDTSMTLCLASSLAEGNGEFDMADQVKKYISWYKDGYMSVNNRCFDIGNATRNALNMWQGYISQAITENKSVFDDDIVSLGLNGVRKHQSGEAFCGNGSLMRVAPIALAYTNKLSTQTITRAQILEYARLSSDVTHPNSRNAEVCTIYTSLMLSALSGASKKELLSQLLAETTFEDSAIRSRFGGYTEEGIERFARPEREQHISSSGYSLDTLEAALWSFFSTENFKDGALRVVNLGNDADTVGAVYGGIAGAFYGIGEIPKEWKEGLLKKEIVEGVAEKMVTLAEAS